jgi:hypothetical protein
MQESLLEFLRSSKSQGASDQTLIELFKRRGWSERQIFAALETYYEEQTARVVLLDSIYTCIGAFRADCRTSGVPRLPSHARPGGRAQS